MLPLAVLLEEGALVLLSAFFLDVVRFLALAVLVPAGFLAAARLRFGERILALAAMTVSFTGTTLKSARMAFKSVRMTLKGSGALQRWKRSRGDQEGIREDLK